MPSVTVVYNFSTLPGQIESLVKTFVKGVTVDFTIDTIANQLSFDIQGPISLDDLAVQILGTGSETLSLNSINIGSNLYQTTGVELNSQAGHYVFQDNPPSELDILLGLVPANYSNLTVIEKAEALYVVPTVVVDVPTAVSPPTEPGVAPEPVTDPTTTVAEPATPVVDPVAPTPQPADPSLNDLLGVDGIADILGLGGMPADPTPPVAEPTPPVAEPTPPVAEPTPPVVEPTPPVAEPTPPVVEPTPLVAEPTAPDTMGELGFDANILDLLGLNGVVGDQTDLSGTGLADILGLSVELNSLNDTNGTVVAPLVPNPAPAPIANVVIDAPQLLDRDVDAGDIVTLRLENADQGGRIVSFGHVFKEGDVPAGQSLVAIIDGQEVPLQIDAKATHPDGSLRHAIVTMELAENAPPALDVALRSTAVTNTASDVDFNTVLDAGYDLTLELTIDGTVHQIDAATLLSSALSAGQANTWMSGNLASEIRVSADVTDDLHVYFDIRAQADGSVKTDVQVAYDWALETSTDNIIYDAKIIQNGAVVEQYQDFEQNHHSTWRSSIWSGDQSEARTIYDTAYMIESGAIASYDLTNKVDDQTVQTFYDQVTAEGGGPGSTGNLETYFPATGGRPEIGVLPSWTVQYLQTMDARAEAVVLANANAAGTIPWHIRDKATGETIQESDHPDYWYDSRASSAVNENEPISYANTSITPDTAHAGSLSYIPYLITGDRYHLDELKAQDAFNVVNWSPGYRHPYLDTTYTEKDADLNLPFAQVRGYAWMLRSMANTAWITPDDDSYKANVEGNLNAWIGELLEKFVDGGLRGNAAGELEGFLEGYLAGDFVQPYMQDYAAIAFSQIAAMGFDIIDPLVQWQVNFISGRFLQEDNGFDPEFATTYKLSAFDLYNPDGIQTDNGLKLYNATWQEAFQATVDLPSNAADIAAKVDGVSLGFPSLTSGFVATARAANASLFNETGDLRALEAFGWIAKQSVELTKGFTYDPGFNINPILSDGTVLSNDFVQIYTDATEAISGSDANELIHAGDGNDVIEAYEGINLVFAGRGNDAVYSGSGDDFIFGGKGADYIDAGAGDDIIKGDAGNAQDVDSFVFRNGAFGNDRIVDFQIGIDRLLFHAAELSSVSSVNDVTNALTADAEGNALLDFGAEGTITLVGVDLLNLDNSHFLLV